MRALIAVAAVVLLVLSPIAFAADEEPWPSDEGPLNELFMRVVLVLVFLVAIVGAVWFCTVWSAAYEGPESAVARGCVGSLVPRYDELSLALMSVAFLFLCLTDPELWAESTRQFLHGAGVLMLVLLIFFAGGMAYSIYHAFSRRPKTSSEKILMLAFAVIANYVAGIAAGITLLRTTGGWLLVFPVVNIFYGVVPMVMGNLSVADETFVSDEDATLPETLSGLLFLAVLIWACRYHFELHWSVTFSICVTYAVSLGRLMQRLTQFIASARQTKGR